MDVHLEPYNEGASYWGMELFPLKPPISLWNPMKSCEIPFIYTSLNHPTSYAGPNPWELGRDLFGKTLGLRGGMAIFMDGTPMITW